MLPLLSFANEFLRDLDQDVLCHLHTQNKIWTSLIEVLRKQQYEYPRIQLLTFISALSFKCSAS